MYGSRLNFYFSFSLFFLYLLNQSGCKSFFDCCSENVKRGECAYSIVLGCVLMGLQDLDPVPTAKPLDLPHCQVSKFLVKVKEKIFLITQIRLMKKQI